MKFDVNILRYIEKDAWRVLVSVEMGMKNHELVPVELVNAISGLKHGGAFKLIRELLKHKLVHHENQKYDGYRLTPLGYDFLAIKAFVNRGAIVGVGRRIGIGKESDVFEVVTEEGETLALKLHRLGRTSFRAVKAKRDYIKATTTHTNWLYLSRLAALKEHAFMKALGENGFPVPRAVDVNRHAVLMSLVDGAPLTRRYRLSDPGKVYAQCVTQLTRLAQCGLVHCDFNEFNIMCDDENDITVIDFPQMVSTNHPNAEDLFVRDLKCLHKFFLRRFDYRASEDPSGVPDPAFFDVAAGGVGHGAGEGVERSLDVSLRASGFTAAAGKDLDAYNAARIEQKRKETSAREDDEDDENTADDASSGDETSDSDSVEGQQGDERSSWSSSGERRGGGGGGWRTTTTTTTTRRGPRTPKPKPRWRGSRRRFVPRQAFDDRRGGERSSPWATVRLGGGGGGGGGVRRRAGAAARKVGARGGGGGRRRRRPPPPQVVRPAGRRGRRRAVRGQVVCVFHAVARGHRQRPRPGAREAEEAGGGEEDENRRGETGGHAQPHQGPRREAGLEGAPV